MTDAALLLGRLLMSAIFILGGFGKLAAFAGTQAMFTKIGMPLPMLVAMVAILIELGGGLAILFGLITRPVAVILAVWCVVTALVAHTNFADKNMEIHFMKNMAMTGGFLYIAVFGAGALSIDAWRRRKSA
jgi:putative oxidoreductase